MVEPQELESLLACPICKGHLQKSGGEFTCEKCKKEFPRKDSIPVFINPSIYVDGPQYDKAQQRLAFWDQGWESRLATDQRHLPKMNPEELRKFILEWVDHYKDDNPRCIEAGPDHVRNKVVLDIGCGAGVSSSIFTLSGARYIGLDISHTAASLALSNIQKLSGKGMTIQGDAEALPFQDNSIEFVYSDGVLHHTPHMEKAFLEVQRILKPGGKAVIALYATHSFMFIQKRLEGFLHGHFSREAQARWMSHETENDWRSHGLKNEWTITISKREIEKLLFPMSWETVRMRRSAFYWNQMWLLGRLINALRLHKPLRFSERLLTPLLGGMWVISLSKSSAKSGNGETP